MAKGKTTVFFCKECGYESAKWLGQCPVCHEWNTLIEEPVNRQKSNGKGAVRVGTAPSVLQDISVEREDRISTGYAELDRVLGGGLVSGSLTLVGGDPGIGKSTLLLQVCRQVSEAGKKVLYISGEESLKQIKLRADRIGDFNDRLLLLCETSLEVIEEQIRQCRPDIVVIDSIQTMYREDIGSAPGSVSQVRESTNSLLQIAKGMNISVLIVGHVTKEGVVAGPRVLEHMVDTVLYFEGDRYAAYRVLRTVKNRFGSTNEIGVFEMRKEGLQEVKNPSEFMLSGRPDDATGSTVTCVMEGTRPILVETQALVARSNFGMPRRTSAGIDYNRVNLLMAVLEKRMGLSLSDCDAYVNVVGGIRVNEPSLDLAVIAALISSYRDHVIPAGTIVFGEVGLSGEVRAVSMAAQRVAEANKLGFDTCILPEVSLKALETSERPEGMKLIGIGSVKDLGRFLEK